MISKRAEKSFDALSDGDRAGVIKALELLATTNQAQALRDSKKARNLGVEFAVRASRALRVLLSREGATWHIVDIVRRGDKRMYVGEG